MHKLLMIFAALAVSGTAHADQFNLICTGTTHEGEPAAAFFAIDTDTAMARFRLEETTIWISERPISVATDRFVFDVPGTSMYYIIDRTDGRYEMAFAQRNFSKTLETGTCEKAAFTPVGETKF